MRMIDLHEDVQTYHFWPDLLGYEADVTHSPFDEAMMGRHADIPGYRQAGMTALITTIFPYEMVVNQGLVPVSIDQIKAWIEWYHGFVEKYRDFEIVTDTERLKNLRKKNKIGLILQLEGMGPVISGDILYELAELGVRSIGLSWNGENELCSTCASANDVGLKPKGREIVKAVIDNGLILDLTHSSFKTQDMILEEFDYDKIMFSHCGVWEVYPFEQNVRQSVIRELNKRRGVVGLTVFDLMINGENASTLDNFMKHVEVFKEFPAIAALGTDFFGFEFDRGLEGIGRVENMRTIYQQVVDSYDQSFADKLFFQNAQNFLERVL